MAGGNDSGADWREDQFHGGRTYTPDETGISRIPHIARKVRTFEPMSGTAVVVAGDEEAGAALSAALRERGIEARCHGSSDLAGDLVELEADLVEQGPDAAVAAGSGQGALALAITASKLGVPVAALTEAAPDADRAAEARIIAALATLDAGSDPLRAAESIAAWLERP